MNQPTNTHLNQHPQTTSMDATTIAHSVLLARAALDFGEQNLSHDVTERLRVARMRALAAASQSKKAPHATQTDVSHFNFGQWFRHLSGWLRGGLATGAIAIAFLLTFGTTQSDLDQLSKKTATVATTPNHDVMAASLPEMQTGRALLASNTITNVQNKTKPRTIELGKVDTNTDTNAVNSSVASLGADDEQVDIFLREKIPLQAYLNDDFNQYANRQNMSDGEQSIEHNDPTFSR